NVKGEGTDVEHGAKIYTDNCVRCHGTHGEGSFKNYYPVIAGQNYHYLMRQFRWIKSGKRRNANPEMVKQIKNFTNRDIKAVMDFASRQTMKQGDWDPNK
ncbi:MAG: c-type cytochrome, partial [SAR324 cluster bacterium]|nr:c-type cytochrome [SAR324 cluster bacterium]